MLGRLERNVDARFGAELARPHAGAVHDELGFDVADRRADSGDDAALVEEVRRGDAFQDGRPLHARPLRERHRHVYGVRAAVFLHVEAGQDVVGLREREELADLGAGDLVHVDPAVAVEGGDAAELFEAIGLRGDLDEADGLEAGGEAGLRFEAAVEIARVLAHLGRCLGRGAERDHQPRGVPRRARREAIALEEDDVFPARVSQVVARRRFR